MTGVEKKPGDIRVNRGLTNRAGMFLLKGTEEEKTGKHWNRKGFRGKGIKRPLQKPRYSSRDLKHKTGPT